MNKAAFLDAILSEPDDLTHRLVFADWLEDNDESDRAEFIRSQIHRETLHPADPEVRDCVRRETELLHFHDAEWSAEIRARFPRSRFHRGFIEEMTIEIDQLLAHGEDLFRLAPIRRLRIRQLMRLPELLRNNSRYGYKLGKLLSRIRSLDLSRDYLSEPVGQDLLNLPRLPQPEELNLEFNALSPPAVSVLAASPVLARVRKLTFNSTVDPAVAIAPLLESKHLGHLEHLYLAGNRQGDVVVSVLLGSSLLARLRSLSLSHTNLTASGLEQLVASPAINGLQSLDIGFNVLGADGMRRLTQSPHLGSLEVLNLSWARLGDAGLFALTYAPLLGQLRGIDLSLNEISTSAGVLLSGYEYPSNLGTLDLIYNPQREPARRLLEQRFGSGVCLFDR